MAPFGGPEWVASGEPLNRADSSAAQARVVRSKSAAVRVCVSCCASARPSEARRVLASRRVCARSVVGVLHAAGEAAAQRPAAHVAGGAQHELAVQVHHAAALARGAVAVRAGRGGARLGARLAVAQGVLAGGGAACPFRALALAPSCATFGCRWPVQRGRPCCESWLLAWECVCPQVEGRHCQQGAVEPGSAGAAAVLAPARLWHHQPQRHRQARRAFSDARPGCARVQPEVPASARGGGVARWRRACRWVKGALDEAPDTSAPGQQQLGAGAPGSAPTVASQARLGTPSCLEAQRAQLAANTLRHCEGLPASHALVAGPSGTGKTWLLWDSTLAAGARLAS